ncbi:c-type cytochrome [Persicitalea jodogahamensis]|uniref:Cytochrome c domain-containing protein n=1 Tax=Persicitalea jodogahamensis TaxID=402147 RepID=A0A8J3D255_9BACT|nr:hypothetical protein [Persicitalea jodogahamensis]GHB56255.1 hypothetical protein GCM10007390_06960 [Persicitalea jodogahamensis]
MTLRKLTLLASIAFVGYAGTNCSSKEDKAQYDRFYGEGRSEREESAGSGSFTPRSDNDETFADRGDQDLKVNPDSINSLSVTENADSEQGTSTALTEGIPETAGKTIAEVSEKEPAKADEAPKQKPVPADIAALLNKNTCSACHKPYERLVGPAYSEVAKKKYPISKIVELVYKPQPENWPGYPPMAPMTQVPKDEVEKLGRWINSL